MVRKWWDEGNLDRGRWRQLHDLINEFLSDEKENWGRTLLAEARTILDDPKLNGLRVIDGLGAVRTQEFTVTVADVIRGVRLFSTAVTLTLKP